MHGAHQGGSTRLQGRSGGSLGWLLPGLAAAVLQLGPAPAAAACQLKQLDMPVRMVGPRPTATLSINGVEVPMLVDSGAFYSVLSPALAAQLQLRLRPLPANFEVQGYTGRIDMMRTVVEKVGVLGAELPNVEFLVGGNELGFGLMGVLGRNVLAIADTEYDLAHGVIRLSFPTGEGCRETNFAHWAGDAPVIMADLQPRSRTDTSITVKAAVNGTAVLALLDTGATRTALQRRVAARAGIADADLVPNGRAGGAGENIVSSWTAPVASFELGGQTITNSRLTVNDTSRGEVGMLLGMDYFLSHRIYVSRLQKRMYATWNGTPVFPTLVPGQGVADARDAVAPGEVDRNDHDALARRGAAALSAGRHAQALEDLNRAVELAPSVAGHRLTRARVHRAMRAWQPALADLDEALRLDAASADARLDRSQLRQFLGERSGALDDLAQLDATLPPTAPQRGPMARMYAALGEVPPALRQFELWMAVRPEDAQMASMLHARCWLRTRTNQDLPLALQDCRSAVARDPGDSSAHASLGWTHLRLNDPQRALRAFDASIKLRSTPMALYGRGLTQLRLADAAAAERDLAAARQASPRIDELVAQAGFEPAPGAPGQARPAPP